MTLAEQIPPSNRNYSDGGAFYALLGMGAYERALSFMQGRPGQMLALVRLGRSEEALQLGQRGLVAGQGVGEIIQVLAELERWDDLVAFVEERFDSAEDLADAHYSAGFGAHELGHLAYAYRRTGQEDKANEALEVFRRTTDQYLESGLDNASLTWSQAHLAMLDGDHDAALAHMERAVEQGFIEDNDFYNAWVVFQPLRGDARLDTLIERMNTLRNEQRVLLGMAPIELET